MTWKLTLASLVVVTLLGQPSLVPDKQIPAMFPGENKLMLIWTNNGPDQIGVEIKANVFQAASDLALRLPIQIVKHLQLLPNQAALMPVSIDTPDVRTKTRLVVQWQQGAKIIGTNQVVIYPPDILRELEQISSDKPIGLASEDEGFSRAFMKAKINFESVQKEQIDSYTGNLLIVNNPAFLIGAPKKALISAARRSVAVISIIGNTGENRVLQPNLFGARYGRVVVVFIRDNTLENFENNPESQMCLIDACR
jgi:hypothetical protein